MALYNKHRPGSLDEIRGNSSAIRSLESMIERGLPHAILLQGPRGCGKTTIARILASVLKCSEHDLHELDIGSFGGVAEIKSLKRNARMKPMRGPVRVWIMDEVHGLKSEQARNTLLKILEEPPPYVYFFLCTTDPQKLTATIRSRCTPITVSPLNEKQTIRFLKEIAEKEKVKIPNKVLKEVYNASLGHPRDALSYLEAIIGLDEEDMLGVAMEEAAKRYKAFQLSQELWARKSWKTLSKIIKDIEEEPETVRQIILSFFNTTLLNGQDKAALVIDEFLKPFFYTGKAGLTLATYKAHLELTS